MSDQIKHECGLAFIRLLKPLSYYQVKYGTSLYGLNKLYLLMEKQHNRGQDGAGVATIKFDVPPGKRYISRYRTNAKQPIQDAFDYIFKRFKDVPEENLNDPDWMKENMAFTGELLLGHVRYGTYGRNSIEYCHPFLRQNNWMTRNLVVAGNFNMTNVDELFDLLVRLGQHPKEKVDTVTVLEKIGHFLDVENEKKFRKYKDQGLTNQEITDKISPNLNIRKILRKSAEDWDGGYAIGGLIGNGDAFIVRDPNGIRPAFYYRDDEIVAVASERPALQTAFNLPVEDIQEIDPGHALVVRKSGEISMEQIKEPGEKRSCSFERIYFSRGSDYEIYNERRELGNLVVPKILESVNRDLRNTVFSYIPNTAEVSFFGMIKGLHGYLNDVKKEKLRKMGDLTDDTTVDDVLSIRPRAHKIAIKDAKMRTFISQDEGRDDLVAHVYDITYGQVRPGVDNLVMIDDSIVRGTTLKQSILRMLDRLGPKKIVIVSSAPQIRYPDCYGIDMAKLGDFVAFRAAIELLHDNNMEHIIDEVYEKCMAQLDLPKEDIVNHVKEIYKPFTPDQISKKIAEIVRPPDINAEVDIIYQSVENLHKACPKNLGDWYFTGNYPTPGGMKVVNQSFINFVQGKNVRAY
jgi:amidophosphoribosyltransferase